MRKAEEEFRGEECRSCAEVRERAMNELDMDDFAKKRLGWQTEGKDKGKGKGRAINEDSDDDVGYGW